jgi:hypothetical protein
VEPVPIESLAFDGQTVFADGRPLVAIESLAPSPAAVPSPAPLADATADISPFDASFAHYHALLSEQPYVAPSLDALLGRVPDQTAAAAAAVGASSVPVDVVDIALLCYRGHGALRRAAEVGGALTEALGRGVDVTAIRPLLDELLDLVPLALDRA